jgi:hypothetical protein
MLLFPYIEHVQLRSFLNTSASYFTLPPQLRLLINSSCRPLRIISVTNCRIL